MILLLFCGFELFMFVSVQCETLDSHLLDVLSKEQSQELPILRMNRKALTSKPTKIHLIHTNKMIEIMNFMKDHLLSTNYFYEEMLRIKKTHAIKDKLRQMVTFLEHPNNKDLRELVLQYYRGKRISAQKAKKKDPWRVKPNDLVINYLKDPFNY